MHLHRMEIHFFYAIEICYLFAMFYFVSYSITFYIYKNHFNILSFLDFRTIISLQ